MRRKSDDLRKESEATKALSAMGFSMAAPDQSEMARFISIVKEMQIPHRVVNMEATTVADSDYKFAIAGRVGTAVAFGTLDDVAVLFGQDGECFGMTRNAPGFNDEVPIEFVPRGG